MPGLGRLVAVDTRDARWPMSLALRGATEPPAALVEKMWDTGPILDQGDTPHCVGFSWRQFLYTDPPGDKSDTPSGDDIYNLAQKNDEWASQAHDGSSVRGGAKGLTGQGLLTSYLWASNMDDLTQWLITKGPVVVGTNWYNSMFNASKSGLVKITPTASIVGGHAYLCVGFDPGTPKSGARYWFCNSWGEGWGDGGKFCLSAADVTRLVFAEYGEACTAVEAAVAPLPTF